MKGPQFRIACCLCRKPVPKRQDVYGLDDEWRRRHPEMTGDLACERCALGPKYYWDCRTNGGAYVVGHIPLAKGSDSDSWDHVIAHGTHVGMMLDRPESAILQGGRDYLRYKADSPLADPDVALRLHRLLYP